MCRLRTQGTMHGCGHYIITKKVGKEDCENQFCTLSKRHPDPKICTDERCARYYGPDIEEVVTHKMRDFCPECEYWFNGDGRRDIGTS